MPNSSRMKWPYPTDKQNPWYEAFKGFIAALDASGFASREDRHLIIGGGGTISWTVPTFSWTTSILISGGLTGFLWEVPSGSVTVADGQVVYVTLSRGPTATTVVSIGVANQAPSSDQALVIAIRIGTRIYLRSGVSITSGGSITEFSPMPGGGGGSALEVDDDGVLVDAAVLLMDFVGDGVTVTQTAPGEVEVDIPALTVEDTGIVVDSATVVLDFVGAGVTASQTAPGEVEVNIPGGGGGTDRHAPAIIVGNSVSGDTLSECHYLDVGDGVQVEAALAAAGAAAVKDVWVRPGVYDLGAGAAVPPLVVPPGVHLRGAGRLATRITTRPDGDQGAFLVGRDATLEDIGVDAALPTGAPCLGSKAVISFRGSRAKGHRLDVDFPGSWTGTEAALTALRYCYECGMGAGPPLDDVQLVDCLVGPVNMAPMFLNLGLPPGSELIAYAIQTVSGFPLVAVDLVRCMSMGADWAVRSYRPVRVLGSSFRWFWERGVSLIGSDSRASVIAENHIAGLGGGLISGRGVYLDTTALVSLVDNYIDLGMAVPGQLAIESVSSTYNTIRGNRGPGTIGAITLDALSTNNEVLGNVFMGAAYTDLGVANDLAHNQ
jgi:hypothetical protein